jgi:uncharacterized LabA/DUF88 family protein
MEKKKVIAYIDGFNLYYGLREKGWRRYYWLNLQLLVQNLLKPHQVLSQTKYFTARISAGDRTTPERIRQKMEAKNRRQAIFLEALNTLSAFQPFEGHYLGKTVLCQKCKNIWTTHEEKMTDVCIATELIMDAFGNKFDTALIISADSDLVPPILAVREKFKEKRIVIAFPPSRTSERLKRVASAWFVIGEAKFRKSMFSDRVKKQDGYVLERPEEWKKKYTS